LINYKQLLDKRLGGTRDTLSLLGLGVGALVSNPVTYGTPWMTVAAAALAAAGGMSLGARLFSGLNEKPVIESDLNINSSKPPMEWMEDKPVGGFLLGYTVDGGEPITVPYEDVMRHMCIIGQSGVGKTVLGRFLMLQQIMAGGAVVFVDGKMNGDDIQVMYNYCQWAGRPQDFVVINPGNPEASNTYNPILFGDPDEVSARILSLIPSTESNAGADYYKQSGNQGVTTIVAALQRTGVSYNFIDLSILLMNQKALTYLEKITPVSDEKTNLSLFLDQYRVAGKDGKQMLDMKRLKETFGGVGGRMFTFGTGKFGKVTNTYSPDVNLFDAIMAGKVIYMPLPTMGKDIAANNFGKMEIGDLRTATSWIQALPESKRPWPPVLNFFDEAGSYVNASWSRMFEQCRSAHMALCPAIQTKANFEAISTELSEMITGNTWTKIFFKIGTQETAEGIADLIGKEKTITSSLTTGGSKSNSAQKAHPGQGGSASDGNSVNIAEKLEENYKISADDLKSIGKGECIVQYGGNSIYHIKVPYAFLTEEKNKECGPMRISTYRKRFKGKGGNGGGIGLFVNAEKYLSTSKSEE